MDAYDRVAAWATARVMTSDFVNATRSHLADVVSDADITWVTRLAATFAMPEFDHALTGAPDLGELLENATELGLELTDAGVDFADGEIANVEPETPVDIGGPDVEAEIDELKSLLDEHEKESGEQVAEMDERRDQLAEKYADAPDDLQQEHLERFDDAAKVAEQALADRQAAEVQHLQEQQQAIAQKPPTPYVPF